MGENSSSESGAVSGVARRYAAALFELAVSNKKIEEIGKDLGEFEEMMEGSDDLRRLVRSPVFTADEQLGAIGAVLDKAGITGLTGNFVRVVAKNRRLFTMPEIIRGFRKLLADHRGEASAEVAVANKLSADQTKELKSTLKGVVGKDVALNLTVDPSLLGGMIVKIGSRQIDTSLRTKLSSLKLALKEAS